MRVLLDHCMPRPFARLLVGHEVQTARALGWDDLSNGLLLAKIAESGKFDVMVTIDKSLAHQQSTRDLPLPVIVIRTTSNAIDILAVSAPEVLKLLGQALQKRVYVVGSDASRGS